MMVVDLPLALATKLRWKITPPGGPFWNELCERAAAGKQDPYKGASAQDLNLLKEQRAGSHPSLTTIARYAGSRLGRF